MAYKTSPETQMKKDQKRKHIIQCAVKVFSAKGYHGTTVKDVVDEADISVGTFYFYFKNKEDLFAEMHAEVSVVFFNMLCSAFLQLDSQIDAGFSKAIAYFLKIIDANRPLAKIILIEAVGLNPAFESKRAEATKRFVDFTAGHFSQMKAAQLIQIPDVTISAMAFIGTLYSIIMEWLQSDGSTPLTDYAYALTVYNLQALQVPYDDARIQAGIASMIGSCH